MVISSRMEQKLLLSGMKQGKLKNLEWQISCKGHLEKKWSTSSASLQIGYAGRVTIIQKRADLFWELAKKLKEKAINFQLNIAGTGDYSEILQQKICEENFQEYIIPVGYIFCLL